MIRYSVSEILDKASRIEDVESRKRELTNLIQHHRPVFVSLFKSAFDEESKWELPAGHIPFHKLDYPGLHTMLYSEARRFYIFDIKSNIPQDVRERQFIQMLESIDEQDALTLIAVKDQKLTERFPGITVDVVDAAVPELGLMF